MAVRRAAGVDAMAHAGSGARGRHQAAEYLAAVRPTRRGGGTSNGTPHQMRRLSAREQRDEVKDADPKGATHKGTKTITPMSEKDKEVRKWTADPSALGPTGGDGNT